MQWHHEEPALLPRPGLPAHPGQPPAHASAAFIRLLSASAWAAALCWPLLPCELWAEVPAIRQLPAIPGGWDDSALIFSTPEMFCCTQVDLWQLRHLLFAQQGLPHSWASHSHQKRQTCKVCPLSIPQPTVVLTPLQVAVYTESKSRQSAVLAVE